MRKAWYPLLESKTLKADEPYGISLLGDPLVLWRDGSGKVACLSDRCPHRSASLAIGFVKDGDVKAADTPGNIGCKYHGWEFSSSGTCERIPAIATKPTKANCATPYPVAEKHGLVWVWPIPGDDSATEDKLPDYLFEQFSDSKWFTHVTVRDLNIDHGLMVENLTDPAHIPFTHAGTIGRGNKKQPITMKTLYDTLSGKSEDIQERPEFLPPGVKATCVHVSGLNPDSAIDMQFIAPCITRFVAIPNNDSKRKNRMLQLHFNIPITKTTTRVIVFISFENFPKIARISPRFLLDWFNNRVIDEDVELLDGQQDRLWAGAKPWNSVVNADTLGAKYRKWREKEERKGGVWFDGFDKMKDIEDIACDRKQADKPANFYDTQSLVIHKPGKDFKITVTPPYPIPVPSQRVWLYILIVAFIVQWLFF